jgi:protein-S-isoprenylcysteine O-methyltransferase Ste14
MFFLAGLGILRALWLPFWGNLMKLGDIAMVPYMILTYPFALLRVDIRPYLAYLAIGLGLLVFLLGTLAWFYTKMQRKGTVDIWLYRFSRHPQYLGWILWSYGLMLLAAQAPIPLGGENPGASLPWLISTLVIVGVALGEEIRMGRERGEEYEAYRASAPFMLPLPRIVSTIFTTPLRILLKKDRPESRKELLATLAIYTTILVLLSLPFVLLDWPSIYGWADWPRVSRPRAPLSPPEYPPEVCQSICLSQEYAQGACLPPSEDDPERIEIGSCGIENPRQGENPEEHRCFCWQGIHVPEGTTSASDLLEEPVYDTEVRVYGTINGLGKPEFPYFELFSGSEDLKVWYDAMVEDNGAQWPAVSVEGLEDGDWVVVTGRLRLDDELFPGKAFWASSIERIE